MTFVCTIKTDSGLVIAADTAASLVAPEGSVLKVWNSSRKLHRAFTGANRKHPVGILGHGDDSLSATKEEIIHDFRNHLSRVGDEFELSVNYTVREVAERLQRFVQEWHIETQAMPYRDTTAFIVVGFGSCAESPSVFSLRWDKGKQQPIQEVLTEPGGIYYAGMTEAAERLLKGHDGGLVTAVTGALWGNSDKAQGIIDEYGKKSRRTLTYSQMPLPEAVETARWLMNATMGYQRFLDYAPTVGGTFECAALAKHSGFKWVEKRKQWKT